MSPGIQERSANSLSYVRPVTVAYVRADGPIVTAARQAWGELRGIAAKAGAREFSAGYGLVHGSFANPSQMYFDACIEVPVNNEGAYSSMFAMQTITGGVYIASVAMRSHRSLTRALEGLLDDPLIGHGLSVAENRPAVITYARSLTSRHSESWSLTLNMPLCWASGNHGWAA